MTKTAARLIPNRSYGHFHMSTDVTAKSDTPQCACTFYLYSSKSLVNERIELLAREHAIPQPKKNELQKTLGKAAELSARRRFISLFWLQQKSCSGYATNCFLATEMLLPNEMFSWASLSALAYYTSRVSAGRSSHSFQSLRLSPGY
ncbi:MAG: hypothetical protein JWP44_4549 [Mucilaginibacter sp.]|jgi:hypothetical protein|nr:hypothetical protein [Mucilaginibacter sp.]